MTRDEFQELLNEIYSDGLATEYEGFSTDIARIEALAEYDRLVAENAALREANATLIQEIAKKEHQTLPNIYGDADNIYGGGNTYKSDASTPKIIVKYSPPEVE